jgi:hypothetical protein
MPYKTFGCSICGKQAPTKYRADGMFEERMAWLRRHRAQHHPTAFKASVKKRHEDSCYSWGLDNWWPRV